MTIGGVMNISTITNYDNAVKEYLSEIKNGNYSDKTYTHYKKVLDYFRTFYLDTNETACESDIGHRDVVAWRNYLREKGRSNATIRNYIRVLDIFAKWASDDSLEDEKYFTKNPVTKRAYPRMTAEDNAPYDKVLSPYDIKLLWKNECPSPAYKKNWARNYAIIVLLMDSGLRNDELRELRLNDIDFKNANVTVRKGKGWKYRKVAITGISLTALEIYLRSGIRPSELSDEDYLFGTTAENKLRGKSSGFEWHKASSQWLSDIVERHVKLVTGNDGFRSHSLRHAYANMKLIEGMPIPRIQAELGHASCMTTERYTGRLMAISDMDESNEINFVRDECAYENLCMLSRMCS